MDNIADTKSV